MSSNSLAQLPLNKNRQHIKVVLKPRTTVLDCLSLSENLKAHVLVEDTAIYLNTNLISAHPAPTAEEDPLKVFLGRSPGNKPRLVFNKLLQASAAIKEIKRYLDPVFTSSDRLRVYLMAQQHQYDVEDLLAFLRKQDRESR